MSETKNNNRVYFSRNFIAALVLASFLFMVI